MSSESILIIVGSGKFAEIFHEKIEAFSRQAGGGVIRPCSWEDAKKNPPSRNSVLLHIGSGRQLQEAIDFCQSTEMMMIQGSSGLRPNLPTTLKFPYIEAPNLSLPIIKLFYLLSWSNELFKGYSISITESHQATKTTIPATAQEFAKLLNVSPDHIKSIRDPEVQSTEFKVPSAFLNAHAIHDIRIEGQGAEISIGTRILGRETYLFGVIELNRIKSQLKNKKYSVTDIVEAGLI